MELFNVVASDNFKLILGGDTQIGNLLVHESGIHEMIEEIGSDTKNHFVHTGDCIDGIMRDDKRFFQETINPITKSEPLLESKYFKKLFKAIAPQTDAILWGNHDLKLWRYGNIVKDDICSDLGVRYGGYVSKISYITATGELMFKLYVTHGGRGIGSTADDPHRRRSNEELILKRHLKDQAADCVLMAKAHSHKLLVLEPTSVLYLYDDGTKLKQGYTNPSDWHGSYIPPEQRWYACSGSFLRSQMIGVTSYVERFEYAPVELGYVVVTVRDRKIQSVERRVV